MRFANDFHEWKSLANRITGDPKSLIMVTNELFYFLQAILCPGHTFRWKQLSIADFAIVAKDGLFWLGIVTSPQLISDVTR